MDNREINGVFFVDSIFGACHIVKSLLEFIFRVFPGYFGTIRKVERLFVSRFVTFLRASDKT